MFTVATVMEKLTVRSIYCPDLLFGIFITLCSLGLFQYWWYGFQHYTAWRFSATCSWKPCHFVLLEKQNWWWYLPWRCEGTHRRVHPTFHGWAQGLLQEYSSEGICASTEIPNFCPSAFLFDVFMIKPPCFVLLRCLGYETLLWSGSPQQKEAEV